MPGTHCREVLSRNGKLAGESGTLTEGGKPQFAGLRKSSAEHLGKSAKIKKECQREKFDVGVATRGLKSVRIRVFPSKIRISALNIQGIRASCKLEPLQEMAYQSRFSVGIITETHLLNDEVDALEIPGYTSIPTQ